MGAGAGVGTGADAGAGVYWKVVWSTGSGLGITGVMVAEAIASCMINKY